MSENIIRESEQYTISQAGSDLIFTWKYIAGLSIKDMANGIQDFAMLCRSHKPRRAIIDARQLDQNSPGLKWVGGKQPDDQEAYTPWWLREVVPFYNEAGISSLAVATGNSQAPGEIPETHPEVKFKMGYFHSLDDVFNYNQ